MSHSTQDKEVFSRREALKTLAAVTGAVTLAGLPKQWETPLVEVGALPAHAQTSICTTSVVVEAFEFGECPSGCLGGGGTNVHVRVSYDSAVGINSIGVQDVTGIPGDEWCIDPLSNFTWDNAFNGIADNYICIDGDYVGDATIVVVVTEQTGAVCTRSTRVSFNID